MSRGIRGSLRVLVVVGIALLAGVRPAAADIHPWGHLIWDPIDEVYVCLGTPINCHEEHY